MKVRNIFNLWLTVDILNNNNNKDNKATNILFSYDTIIPCTWMYALKPRLLGNRCTIKQAFLAIRIQVGYTVQYIDKLKFYLILNKHMSKKRVLWCIFFPSNLGFNALHPSTSLFQLQYFGNSGCHYQANNYLFSL